MLSVTVLLVEPSSVLAVVEAGVFVLESELLLHAESIVMLSAKTRKPDVYLNFVFIVEPLFVL
jgi:hypothetical protein